MSKAYNKDVFISSGFTSKTNKQDFIRFSKNFIPKNRINFRAKLYEHILTFAICPNMCTNSKRHINAY